MGSMETILPSNSIQWILTAKDALLKFRRAKARPHKYLLKTGALSFMA